MGLTVSQKLDALINQNGVAVNTATITDTSNYSFYGLDINNYVGILAVSFDGITIYENLDYDAPDIAAGGDDKELPLVLDESDNPKQGTYTVVLSIKNTVTSEVLTNTTNYVFNYTAPEVEISQVKDGYASTFESEDLTDYTGFTYTRSHEVVVPDGSGLADTTSTAATVSYAANIWSGEFTTNITSVITYINGFLTVVDEVEGTASVTVYKITRNTVFEAIADFNVAYNTAIGTNPKLALDYGVISNQIDGYIREYNAGLEEHDTQKCYDALVDISELLSPDYISALFTTTEEITPFSFTVTSETEILNFINAITASTTDLNKIKDLNVTTDRVVITDGDKIVTKADFTFDGTNLSIPSGGEYRIGTTPISTGYAPINSPTFTGTVVLPSTTSIGNVSNTEIGYLDGVTSAIQTQLNTLTSTKAPIANPTFTGVPAAPTADVSTNTTQIATTAFVKAVIAALVDSSPATLDTLNELAAALGDDPNFSTTMTNALAGKAPIANPTLTGNTTIQGDAKARVWKLANGSDVAQWTAQLNGTTIEFYNATPTKKWQVDTNGAATFVSTVTATNFILSSDENKKQNIKPIDINEAIDDITLKQFTFKSDESDRLRYGVIAQEVEQIMPELVFTDEDGNKSVGYIDYLIMKIARLEKRILELENN
jgi:hypothetical protein